MHILNKLKNLIKKYEINGYLLPKNDEFFSEHSNPDRLEKLTGFKGSAGIALVLENKSYLIVDGRYILQGAKESGKNFKIINSSEINLKKFFEQFSNLQIGYDPKLFTYEFISKYLLSCNIKPLDKNLVDMASKIKSFDNNKKFFSLSTITCGESMDSKINRLINYLKKKKVKNIFISSNENVAWLFNIRGFDNPNSPIPNCKVILNYKKQVFFFSELKKIKNLKKNKQYKKFKFYREDEFLKVLNSLEGKTFLVDKNSCSVFHENLIRSRFRIKDNIDPCYSYKSIKNKTEIKNIVKTHIYDGVALTKFLYWIKNLKKLNLTEFSVEKKLEFFRRRNKLYKYPSFNTIVGSGPNGSIIHYRANKYTNRKIKKEDLLLIDSGGQYNFGTTDVTRTISLSKQNQNIKNIYTKVLKGHIAVVTCNLSSNINGSYLDKIARKPLRDIKLDYPHSTGHGVGYFLNVHEGPISISKFSKKPFLEGMVLSNEPGYYKKNKFGIRIENLICVKKNKKGIFFNNLTLAPIEKDLINFKLLNQKEKIYLKNYNKLIFNNLKNYLSYREKRWLQDLF